MSARASSSKPTACATLVIDDAEFAKEINVVLEERRLRTDDNPQSLALEAVHATAWQTSPYRYPTIGWEADIKHMTADDLRAWYMRWYGPNNAIVVVVGDVEPDAVLALAREHFGPLKPSDIPPPRSRPEVAQVGRKQIEILSEKARLPYLVMAWKTPALGAEAHSADTAAWETYALDVLAETLDGDDSARLPSRLVRGRELAAAVDVSYASATRLDTLFYVSAVPRDGVSVRRPRTRARRGSRRTQGRAAERGRTRTHQDPGRRRQRLRARLDVAQGEHDRFARRHWSRLAPAARLCR